MMNDQLFQVEVLSETLRFEGTTEKQVYGVIFVKSGDVSFPDAHWTDFIVTILGWWANTLKTFDFKTKETATLRFMDGPFEIRLRPVDGERLEIEFVEAGITSRVVHQTQITLETLRIEIYSAIATVVQKCASFEGKSKDIEKLKTLLNDLPKNEGLCSIFAALC
jgi:hypothetical protein